MPPKRDVEAPICLGNFFAEAGDDAGSDEDANETGFAQTYEVTELEVLGKIFRVRQFAWHRANANKIWPGTFNLAEYIDAHQTRYRDGSVLELGAATGALTLFLSTSPHSFNITTSDIDDGGEVEENIAHNFRLNGLEPPLHVPHTWGDGWPTILPSSSNSASSNASSSGSSISPALSITNAVPQDSTHRQSEPLVQPQSPPAEPRSSFRFIIASDILLYVSAYPALVKTLCELFGCGAVAGSSSGSNGSSGNSGSSGGSGSGSSGSSGDSSSGSGGSGDDSGSGLGAIAGVRQDADALRIGTKATAATTTTTTTTTTVAPTAAPAPASASAPAPVPAPTTTASASPAVSPAPQAVSTPARGAEEFLMSWNRRIAESKVFFDLMGAAGFVCEHKGKCVYSFTRPDSGGGGGGGGGGSR